jgi:hypothetical protein
VLVELLHCLAEPLEFHLERYTRARLAAKAAPATVNRELAILP